MKRSEIFFGYVNGFVSRMEMEMNSRRTINTYIEGLNSFRRYFEEVKGIKAAKLRFDDVTADSVRDYLAWLVDSGKSQATRNSRLTTIRRYISFCAEQDISLVALEERIRKIRSKTVHPKKHNWLDRHQIDLLLSMTDHSRKGIRDRFLMLFMFSTGVRLAELIGIRLKDIILRTDYPYVSVTGKGSKTRIIPLPKECIENLKYYLTLYHRNSDMDDPLFYVDMKGGRFPMSPDNVQRVLSKYGDEARKTEHDFPKVHPHLLRHSYGAQMYRNGLSLPEVAKLMGHEYIQTTEIYAETDVDMINEAISRITDPNLENDFDKLSEQDQLVVMGLKKRI